MIRISYSKALVIVASLLLINGCESTPNFSSSDSVHSLNELVENTACTASFQCKVLAVGQRACGGPSRYIIYSSLNTEQEKAEQLAQQVTKQEAIENKKTGANDCSPVLPIHALCINQQCQKFDIN